MNKPVTIAVASIAGAVLLAGCSSSSTKGKGTTTPASTPNSSTSSTPGAGNSSVSAPELEKKVVAATQAATSLHLVGTGAGDGGKPVAFDIHFGPHKTAGSITQNNQPIKLINPGGASVYFQADDSLWKQVGGAAAVSMFHGKWVKVAANDKRFADLSSSFDKDSLLGGMFSDDSGDLQVVGPSTVDGTAAIEYRDADHNELYVAATGKPVLLKLVDLSNDGGTLTFSDYDKPYSFSPPPASQTVDFSKVESGN
ncbi:MAG TPA: hypothetical protein VGL39_09660 [Jatrophihabitantaceae bacterium]|jgi:hypothetical protein